MTVPDKPAGLVLAGGRSRRMGSDKAALKMNGATQLERAVALLQRHVEPVFVSARKDQADDPVRAGFDQIADAYDDLGPIAGILSAFDKFPERDWLVLACDLPNIDDGTISYLLEQADPASPATAARHRSRSAGMTPLAKPTPSGAMRTNSVGAVFLGAPSQSRSIRLSL